jgi:hypothetical protein
MESTETLEQQISEATKRRVEIEQFTKDFQDGIVAEKQKADSALALFKSELDLKQEYAAFKELMAFVNTLQFISDTYTKVSEAQKQVSELQLSANLSNQEIMGLLEDLKHRLDKLIQDKSVNAELEKRVLNQINAELNK